MAVPFSKESKEDSKHEAKSTVPSISTSTGHNEKIASTIDVFLSSSAASQLYLLQYCLIQSRQNEKPSTPFNAPYPTAARFKRNHGKVELDFSPTPRMECDASRMFRGDRIVYHSQTIPIQTHLCLGMIVNSNPNPNHVNNLESDHVNTELRIIQLNGMNQMRPIFKHSNYVDKYVEYEDEDAEPPITLSSKLVVFQPKESDRAALARKSSFAFKKAVEDGASWSKLNVHHHHPDEINHVLNNLLSRNRRHVVEHQICQSAYIRTIGNQDLRSISCFNCREVTTKRLVARVVALMATGGLIHYDVLRSCIECEVSDADLLHAISVVAVQVRGNFVLNSRYLTDYPSLIRRVRTFILLVFHLDGFATQSQLNHVYNCKSHVLQILKLVAKTTPFGWILKLPENIKFIEKFPQQKMICNAYWEIQAKRYRKELKLLYGGIKLNSARLSNIY